jgi:ElaB/YqjD/DUF883 family membrane-anchored ribosome-binding protein
MTDSNARQQNLDAASDDLKELLREAERALGHVGQAGDKFDDLRERLRAAVAPNGYYGMYELREEAIRRVKQADTMVRQNPYVAIGVAAGVGALLGLLVSRTPRPDQT